LKTLQKYLFREWLGSFLAISIVMLFVVISTFAGDLFSDVARGNIPAALLGKQLLFRIPDALQLILPLSLFIAVIFGLGRLYRDQEMAVMYACGFRWRDMLRPLAFLTVPLAVLLLVNSFLAGPAGQALSGEMVQQAFRKSAIWGLRAGDFQSLQDGSMVIYVESINESGDELHNIFIHMYGQAGVEGGAAQTWTAQTGHYRFDEDSGKRYIRLLNGEVTEHDEETGEFRRISFSEGDLRLPEQEQEQQLDSAGSLSAKQLIYSTSNESSAELHWRLAPAIAILLLSLLALPLAHSAPRDGRYGRLVMGLLVYVVYVNLLTLGRVWLADGTVHRYAGLWWIHAGLAVLVVAWTVAHLKRSRG
jgi:lipopolysaccharide export system permease protein